MDRGLRGFNARARLVLCSSGCSTKSSTPIFRYLPHLSLPDFSLRLRKPDGVADRHADRTVRHPTASASSRSASTSAKRVRKDPPEKNGGTPTMGGVLICIAILVPTLLWSDLWRIPFVWLAVLVDHGLRVPSAFADDYIKVVHKRNLGLTSPAEAAILQSHCQRSGVAVDTAGVMREQGRCTPPGSIVPFFKRHPALTSSWTVDGLTSRSSALWPLAFLPFVLLCHACHRRLQATPST